MEEKREEQSLALRSQDSVALSLDPSKMAVIGDDGVLTTTNGLGILPSFWGIDSTSINAVKTAVSVSNTRHGLLAAVPIICRGDECPYLESCYIDPTTRNVVANKQGRCPIEIATIISQFEKYCKHFGIEDREEDAVDMGMVRDLVDVEIQILRCDNKIAIDGDFIEQVIAGISNQGQEYRNPALHLAWLQKEKLRNERYKILRLLDSTRADKAKKDLAANDASRKAVDLVQRAMELQRSGKLQPLPMMARIIDVTPEEDHEQPVDNPVETVDKQETQKIKEEQDTEDVYFEIESTPGDLEM